MERGSALLGQDTGWQEVARKKKRQAHEMGKTDIATSAWKVPYANTVSFFFSEFPETHGAKEMLKVFALYGDAMEVVIPPRRDSQGKRFGFVRFCNVGDSRVFAVKLDNIIFGAKKIHVNVPKFQRERNDTIKKLAVQHPVATKQQGQPRHQQQPRKGYKVWRKKTEGESGVRMGEKQVQRNGWKKDMNQRTLQEAPRIVYHRKNNIAEICHTVPEEEMQRFRKMYIGMVRTPRSTYTVHEWFSIRGFFSIKTTPLGANKVLLEELEEGIIPELINTAKDWIYEKFEDVRGWDLDVSDNERVVWIRCHGVPSHAWNESFLRLWLANLVSFLGWTKKQGRRHRWM